jgi:hypothetical protein
MGVSISSGVGGGDPRSPLRRWGAALRRPALDRRLLAGADPGSDPALRRRVVELESPQMRRTLAGDLEGIVEAGERPPPRNAAVPLDRRAVRASRRWLLQLAQDLREPGEVSVRGILLIRRLLTDGASPLYLARSPAELELAVRHARSALLLR